MSRELATENLTPLIRTRAVCIGLVCAAVICLLTPVNNIAARTSVHHIRPFAAHEGIITTFTINLIVSITAYQKIVTIVTMNNQLGGVITSH